MRFIKESHLCVVKWTAKFGYNAVAETKKLYPKGLKGFFARIFQDYDLVPTGRIIDSETGEVIFDKDKN